MNLQQYFSKRQAEDAKRKELYKTFRNSCLKCRRPTMACFCRDIIPIETNNSFVILMHPKEAKNNHLGTGRLTNLCLNNCDIIEGENFDQNQKVQKIIACKSNECFILYPGKSAHNISMAPLPRIQEDKKNRVIFIIDGTWPSAKAMMRESKILHHLPRISFNCSNESLFSIKQQPAKYCLSTIESVHNLLNEFDKWDMEELNNSHHILIHTLQKLVDYQLNCAADPNREGYRRKSYKKPSERGPGKKWQKWNICYQ